MELFQILDGKLWQGSQIDHWSGLDPIKPDIVIDLSGLDTDIPAYTLGQVSYVYLGMEDGPLPTPLNRFHEVAAYAASAIADGAKVLDHCAAGINRSSLMSGQIIYNLGIAKSQDIITLIRSKRPGALSNQTFAQYLQGLR